MASNTILDPSVRFGLHEWDKTMTNPNTATVIGDVLSIAVTLLNAGGEFYAMKIPATADINKGIVAVALAPAVAAGQVQLRFQGRCKAWVALGAGALAIGDPLVIVNNSRLFKTVADSGAGAGTDQKIFAYAMEANAGTSGNVLVEVMLSGVYGFGAAEA